VNTRTEELKGRLEKARAVARAHKKDDLAQALVLMLELVIEIHERIDRLEEGKQ
jgi:hypothetical protein